MPAERWSVGWGNLVDLWFDPPRRVGPTDSTGLAATNDDDDADPDLGGER
jgi:hypothetical protein